MADIKQYTDQIASAVYGEEVRGSIINALNKVNDDNNSYNALKAEITQMHEEVESDYTAIQALETSAKASEISAKESADKAAESEENLAEAVGTAKGYMDASEGYKEEAKSYAEQAKAVANIDVATLETPGIVKPDGSTITVDEQGTIVATERHILKETKNVYVSPSGSDTTGDGTQENPWKTIQKAVDECPSVEGTNTISIPLYRIFIANGEYNEVITICGKNVYFTTNETEPSVTINGNIIISKNAIVEIRLPLSIQVQNTGAHAIAISNNSYLYTTKAITLVGTGRTNNRSGLEFQTASSAFIYGALIVKDCAIGVSSNHVSRVFCSSVTIENCTTAFNANVGGILSFSATTLLTFTNVTTKYATLQGGRILTDSQGWQLIGSVTGANFVAIDSNLYTEFVVCVKLGGDANISMTIPTVKLGESFAGGYTQTSATTGQASVTTTKTNITLHRAYRNGADVSSTTTMTVYGRRA